MATYNLTVYYTSGGSDKEYHLHLTGSSGLLNWEVSFEYGRRGSASSGGTKIRGASESKGRQVFEKYIREKVGKGYTLHYSGEPGTTTIEEAIQAAYLRNMLAAEREDAYQGDLVMQGAEERLGVQFQARAPEPEESSLHTGNRDMDLGPAPQPELLEVVTSRRILWSGKPKEPVVSATAREVVRLTRQTPPQTLDASLVAALHSQQPTPVENDSEVEHLLYDEGWGLQDKYDGKKVTVRTRNGQGQAFNKKGQPITIPSNVMEDILACGLDLEVDGELIGQKYVVYDILHRDGTDLRTEPYQRRHGLIPRAVYESGSFGRSIEVAPLYVGREAKRRRFEEIKQANGEGVVFKRLGATFTVGKGTNMRKHKFYATASCIVTAGRDGKRSVGLKLYGPDSTGVHRLIEVGNVTIPNKMVDGVLIPIPEPGDIIEVRYLYAYPGGSLYQPTYIGPRDDIDAEECLMTQLKYKQEG